MVSSRDRKASGVLLLLCSVLAVVLCACSSEKIEHISTPTDINFVDAGRGLVQGVAACGYCHGALPDPAAALSGGQRFRDLYGETEVPNITPGRDGLKEWSSENFLNYFRNGLNKEGEMLSQIPHQGMEWMSDQDLLSIFAYLMSLPPARGEREHARVLSFLDRNTSGFFEGRREVTGFVPDVPRRSGARFGQYLVNNVASCGRCHHAPDSTFSSGAYLAGGEVIRNEAGERVAPDITNSEEQGIGDWSEREIVTFLREGKRPNGSRVDPRFCPLSFYRNAAEEDLKSIAQYLKTVSPEE